jgi:hypothetical protein
MFDWPEQSQTSPSITSRAVATARPSPPRRKRGQARLPRPVAVGRRGCPVARQFDGQRFARRRGACDRDRLAALDDGVVGKGGRQRDLCR